MRAGLGVVLAWALAACSGAPLPDDLARAQGLEAARRDDEALAAYRRVRERCSAGQRPHDDCGLAAFREAQLLERLERYEEAAAAFVRVREFTLDGRLSARALERAAELDAERLSRRDEALRLCEQIVRRWPDEIPAEDALKLMVELRRDGDAAALAAELDRLDAELREHEVSAFVLLYRAELAERAGDDQLAVDRYDELWRRFPHGALRDDAAYRAGELLRKGGRFAEAVRRLERLERTWRSSIIVGTYNKLLLDDAAMLLGRIYLEDLHQPERAISALRGFLKRQPKSLLCDDALLLMARAALARHDPHEACDDLQRLLREYPDGNQVRKARAEVARLSCAR